MPATKITITKDGDVWVAKFDKHPDTIQFLKDMKGGGWWGWKNGRWETDSEKVATRTILALKQEEMGLSNNITHPEAPVIEVPVPEGIVLRDYQKQTVWFLLERMKALLASDMGVGKTASFIGLWNIERPRRTLILCPASLCLNWEREFRKFGIDVPEIQIVKSTKATLIKEGIVIVNYEKVVKLHGQLIEEFWDLAGFDESHKLKNNKAAVTKHVYGQWHKEPAKRIFPIPKHRLVLITGTPMLSRPSEMWTAVKEVDPNGLGRDWRDYHLRYCGMYKNQFGGFVTSGATNTGELSEKVALFAIRHTKKDVLKELPSATHQVIPLEPDSSQEKLLAEENGLLVGAGFDISGFDPTNDTIRLPLDLIATIRKQIALSKLPSIYEIAEDFMEGGKLVIGAHHREVIENIHNKFPGSVMLYGGMSNEAKQASVDRFQNDPDCKLFIGSLMAAGVGITLTAASQMMFVESDWTPGIMMQFCDRIMRIGQKSACHYLYPVLAGSLDEKMLSKWLKKKSIIDSIIDRKS